MHEEITITTLPLIGNGGVSADPLSAILDLKRVLADRGLVVIDEDGIITETPWRDEHDDD